MKPFRTVIIPTVSKPNNILRRVTEMFNLIFKILDRFLKFLKPFGKFAICFGLTLYFQMNIWLLLYIFYLIFLFTFVMWLAKWALRALKVSINALAKYFFDCRKNIITVKIQ
jgi:hypothetical protein